MRRIHEWRVVSSLPGVTGLRNCQPLQTMASIESKSTYISMPCLLLYVHPSQPQGDLSNDEDSFQVAKASVTQHTC